MSRCIVIGGGPAGLMAAQVLAPHGVAVDVYDAMPSVGRKFLLAGKGGLNLTHAEPFEPFLSRYGAARPWVQPWLQACGPEAVRAWAQGLGVATFVGTSGRVFPHDLKAAPLLRAWLHRLREAGVGFHARHRWTGWDASGACCFDTPQGPLTVQADTTVLALGGASWPQLGSDGAWVPLLAAQGVRLAPLQAANCGFDVGWSAHLRQRFAGQPVKSVALDFVASDGTHFQRQGEFVLTATGIEGSLVYAASALLRDEIAAQGQARVHLNLLPGRDADWVRAQVAHPRGSRSLSAHLKSRLGLYGAKTALLQEVLNPQALHDATHLAHAIQALPLLLKAPRPIAEAISSAGGVRQDALDAHLGLRARPGVFCAGEMLDWEAPTGGYLLTACLASGHAAAMGVLHRLAGEAAGAGGLVPG